jgi:hypothetical protein
MSEDIKQTNLNKSIHQLREITREWYKNEEYDPMYVSLSSRKRRFDNV